MNSKNIFIKLSLVIIVLIVLNLLSNAFSIRFDLTKDKRYTLSNETIEIVKKIKNPLTVKVYLQGNFPAEFKRIQLETNQFLEELQALNKNIQYRFVDPLNLSEELIKKGLQPSRLTVQEDGKMSEAIIFPWATISYKNNNENVSLLVNSSITTQEEQLQHSIESLEYNFVNAIHKLTTEKNKKIAVIKGNGELDDINLFSFLKNLGAYYKLAEFTLDSVSFNPQKTVNQLSDYDLAIIAKPSQPFTEQEKYTLDQYIMAGGKTMWLIDNISAEIDSLMVSGKSLAFNRDLNLTDLLFSYGVRINYNITKDMYSSTIRLASGNVGNQIQYQDLNWPYYPLIISGNNSHPIVRNLEPILLKFPSNIDTLDNGIDKTLLLASSPYTKVIGTPVNVSLDEIAIKPDKDAYSNGRQIFGVLLEGSFKSAYSTRIKPFELTSTKDKEKSVNNRMIVISDGDIIANETFRGEPLPLELDKWTGRQYGNKSFLLNAIHYLLDDSGILKLRSKNLQIQFLDKEKAYREKTFWQIFNLALPLVILGFLGFIFHFTRKRKFSS